MATAVEEHNKDIVQRWIDEVFNAGRVASVEELKVSSYLDWTPLPAPYQDVNLPVSGIKDALPEWLGSLPDFRFSSDRMMAESEFVVCIGRWSAHHKGTYKGHAPTDKRLGGTRIDIFRVAGDKMVEHWGCGNELAFMQMIGALGADNEGAPTSNADVARRFVERVIGKGDVAAVAELLDPCAIDRSGQGLRLLALLTVRPDVDVSVVDVAEDGDEVAVRSRVDGTRERVDRFRLSSGKIVECLGVEPVEAPTATRNGHVPASDDAKKAVVRSFIDKVLDERDFALAQELVAPDATDHITGTLTAYLTLAAFPDYRLSTEHVIVDHDSVTVLATWTGTHERPLMGLDPTHKGVTGRVAFSFRLDGGRIAETWIEPEPWTLLQQLETPAFARGG
jgi:predicted ester cyclase